MQPLPKSLKLAQEQALAELDDPTPAQVVRAMRGGSTGTQPAAEHVAKPSRGLRQLRVATLAAAVPSCVPREPGPPWPATSDTKRGGEGASQQIRQIT